MKLSLCLLIGLTTLIGLHQAVAQVSFTLATNYAAGSMPSSVVVADANGDGNPDLISANEIGNILTVLTNSGNGVFAFNATYTSHTPESVISVDVNGDGSPDLVFANYNRGTLSVLTNNGSGIFGSNATLLVNGGPDSVVAADINGDGKPDLICANGGTLSVWTNNGTGVFSSNANYHVDGEPSVVIVADVNGNGKPDLISLNANGTLAGSLTILTNDGNGNFGSNATYNAYIGPSSLIAADVNGDGKPDLICANAAFPSEVFVLTNNGSGIFGSNAIYTVGEGISSIVAADVNGDGKLDLICANNLAVPDTLLILTNDGNGVFGSNTTLNVGRGVDSVAAADVNGDGKLDLICANENDNTLSVLINTSTFPPPTSTPSLAINSLDNGILVSWPSASAGWSLQQNPDLTTSNWSPSGYSGYPITDDGTNKSLIIVSPKGNLFFRLLHP